MAAKAKFKVGDVVQLLYGGDNDQHHVGWVDWAMDPNVGRLFTIEYVDRRSGYVVYTLKEDDNSYNYDEVWLSYPEKLEKVSISNLMELLA